MAEKMSIEEFKERVVQRLKEHYRPKESVEDLREIVNDEYFASAVEDGYNNRFGIEYGIDYVAYTIDMCI